MGRRSSGRSYRSFDHDASSSEGDYSGPNAVPIDCFARGHRSQGPGDDGSGGLEPCGTDFALGLSYVALSTLHGVMFEETFDSSLERWPRCGTKMLQSGTGR